MPSLIKPLDSCVSYCTTREVPDYPEWQSCQVERYGIIYYTARDYRTYTVFVSEPEKTIEFGYYTDFDKADQYFFLRAIQRQEQKDFLRRVRENLDVVVMECIL